MVLISRTEILRTLSITWQTLKRFENLDRRRDAAALTYTTLFALVPILTLTFTVLSMIPELRVAAVDYVDEALGYILPQGSEIVTTYLIQFSQQAKKLTGIGIIFLVITALMLLRTIEEQFNKIWNVSKTRSKIYTFFRYWAVLTLGPLLIVAIFASSSYLSSLSFLPGSHHWLTQWLAIPLPWILTSLILCLLYVVVPNYKVPVRHALLAAIFVATLLIAGQWLLTNTISLFPTYKLIYGAFAAVPLFLLWLNISWMMLLFGAELSYGLSHHRRTIRPRESVIQRLRVAQSIYLAQQSQHGIAENELQQQVPDISVASLHEYLTEFEQKGWASLSHNECWLWVRDPRTLSIREFLADETLGNITQVIAAGKSEKNKTASDNRAEHDVDNSDQELRQRWQNWIIQLNQQQQSLLDGNLDQLWYMKT